MADWLDGYSSEWTVCYIDVDTWEPTGEVGGVVSVSITRDGTDSVPLIETGQMELTADGIESPWCRVYMKAKQESSERVPIATMLFERQSAHFEKGVRTVTARGRSVLQPVADRKMPRGSFVPAGADGAAYVVRLLRECTPAPATAYGSFTLVDDFVFDLGCSYLEAAWQVLNASGWCMQIDGRGEISVLEKPTSASLELDKTHAGLLIPGVDDDFSIIDVPNRYYAIDDDRTAEAVNDDPASVVGYAQRGRWVDMVDTSPTLVNGESLERYAERKLAEESTVTRTYSYTREFWPDVVPFDIVSASLASNGIEGDLRVMKQELMCGAGITVSETAGMEMRL